MGWFLDARNGKYAAKLVAIADMVKDIQRTGMPPALSFYTLHGVEHHESMLRILDEFLLFGEPLEHADRLSFLLTAAVCLHDVGMFMPATDDTRAQAEAARQSLSAYLRGVHAARVEEFLADPYNFSFLSHLGVNPGDINMLSSICAAHGTSNRPGISPYERFLASLLRVADVLDVGPERAPLATFQHLFPAMDLEQKYHWAKHNLTAPWENNVNVRVVMPGQNQHPKRSLLHVVFQVRCLAGDRWVHERLQGLILQEICRTLESPLGGEVLLHELALKVDVRPYAFEERVLVPAVEGKSLDLIVREYLTRGKSDGLDPGVQKYLQHLIRRFEKLEVLQNPLDFSITPGIEEVLVHPVVAYSREDRSSHASCKAPPSPGPAKDMHAPWRP